MIKKQSMTIILILMTLLIFTGCSGGSYKIINGDIDTQENGMNGQYKEFTGKYYRKVKFGKGDVVSFNIIVNTSKGNLSFKLLNPEGEVVNELEKGEIIEIVKTGLYKVQVESNKHKGSFIISWSKK
jgi:hypothetical protein